MQGKQIAMRKLNLQHDWLQSLLLGHLAKIDLKNEIICGIIKQLGLVVIALLSFFPLHQGCSGFCRLQGELCMVPPAATQ